MIKIRKANPNDFPELKHLLMQLTAVGDVESHQIDSSVYDNIYVGCNLDGNIVGCATLIIENKIIHNGSKVGHIEDVVVDINHRNLGIGKLLIDHCVSVAKNVGCYKVILDCDPENALFYERCGFKINGLCMRYNIN